MKIPSLCQQVFPFLALTGRLFQVFVQVQYLFEIGNRHK